MTPYYRFDAWKLCHRLAVSVYQHTKKFPREERFGLTAQARRAAFSAPANIAEGASKDGTREFARYLNIALGSPGELSYILVFAKEVGLLDAKDWEELWELRDRAAIVTWRLYQSVRQHG